MPAQHIRVKPERASTSRKMKTKHVAKKHKDTSAKTAPETKPEDFKEDCNMENAGNEEGKNTEEPIPKKEAEEIKEQLDEDVKEDGRERKKAVITEKEDDEKDKKDGGKSI
ncbi:hypothetical protein STEG23_027767 [Scotinomys teguina]